MEKRNFETLHNCSILGGEYLKDEIRNFTMNFSNSFVKQENKDRNLLEQKLNKLEKNLTNFQTNSTISNVNKNCKIYVPKK